MSAQTKGKQIRQALIDLDILSRASRWGSAPVSNIRDALESAQREAEAWETIEAYCKADSGHFSLDCENGFDCSMVIAEPDRVAPHAARIEALEAAAKWCRAEMAK